MGKEAVVVVVDDHDGVCVCKEGAFVDFAGVDE